MLRFGGHKTLPCRDDVVFHDDFLSIFPEYWDSVPVNYEYIAVGMIPRHFNTSERTVYGEPQTPKKWPPSLLAMLGRSATLMQQVHFPAAVPVEAVDQCTGSKAVLFPF